MEAVVHWTPQCWISDFGLARVITEADPQVQLESTWVYRAPEGWHTSASVSPLSDVYSFGVMLYEMLTGKLPFQATTREEWSRSHREEFPYPPKDFPQEGPDGALMELALRCLRKDPADRPQGFEALSQELFQLAQGYDDLKRARVFISTRNNLGFFSGLPIFLSRADRIDALIKNGDHQLALTELETMSKDSFDGQLWYLYGHALALNGRDEEALTAIKKALQFDITERLYFNCNSLYALSLKHLGRYQEAIDLYKQLLVLVPDEMLGRMVTNLATVYIESNQPKEAVDYLVPYLQDNPEDALGWINLGSAYRDLDHYPQAVRCYQRAIAIAPERAEVQVLLGEALMHLGQIEDAEACFQAAWNQGYKSYNWLRGYMICSVLLDRKQLAVQLGALAQDNFSKDEVAELIKDVQKQLEELTKSWQIHTQNEEQQVTSQEGPHLPQGDGYQEPIHKTAQQTKSEPLSQEENTAPSLIQNEISTPDADSPNSEQNFTMPFLNPHFYLGEGVYSLDFYYDPAAPDYIKLFVHFWRTVTRDPRLRTMFGRVLTLSTIPFYFTRCPICEVPILTNLWPEKPLTCQRCGKEHEANAIRDGDLDVLLGHVLEALGKQLVDLTGQMQVLLIQPVDEEDHTKLIEAICFAAGFTPLSQAHPVTPHLLYTLKKRGILNWRPYSLWQKMSDDGQYAYAGEAPPEVEHVVRMIRLNGLELNTVSGTYDPADPFFGVSQDRTETEMIEELLRKAEVAADQDHVDTLPLQITLLLQLGKMNEAKAKAQALISKRSNEAIGWILLGQTEMVSGHFQEAVEAFGKANTIDPVASAPMFFLAQCYRQLGDTIKATMWDARWRSSGGSL